MLIEKLITFLFKAHGARSMNLRKYPDTALPRDGGGKKYFLYAHIPFCATLCPYCSFNRYLFDPALAKDYFSALRQEIKIYKELNYGFSGVYIGGGTPTILLEELGEIISLLRALFSVKEISVETNPNHLTKKNIEALKQLGIQRLSVGVQSFNDPILKSIERYRVYGSGAKIQEALLMAKESFATVNADMIFNFPGQTKEALEDDINTILRLKLGQVTFYPLMASPKSIKKPGAVNYLREKNFYAQILEGIARYYKPATVWCFSRDTGMVDEYIIKHDEYLGIGSGAFGFINGHIFANTFSLPLYIRTTLEDKLPIAFYKKFSAGELMRYDFLMKLFGLRLPIKEIEEKYAGLFCLTLRKEIAFFKTIRAIEEKEGALILTKKGMYYWLIMMREFFTGVNSFREYCRKDAAALAAAKSGRGGQI